MPWSQIKLIKPIINKALPKDRALFIIGTLTCPNKKAPPERRGFLYNWSILLFSHSVSRALPSPMLSLTAEFGMGSGVSPTLSTLQNRKFISLIFSVLLLAQAFTLSKQN